MKGFTFERILLMLLVTLIPIGALVSEVFLVNFSGVELGLIALGVLSVVCSNFSVLIWHRWRKPFAYRLKDATFYSILISGFTLLILVYVFGPFTRSEIEVVPFQAVCAWFWLFATIEWCRSYKNMVERLGRCLYICAAAFCFLACIVFCAEIANRFLYWSHAMLWLYALLVMPIIVSIAYVVIKALRHMFFKRK